MLLIATKDKYFESFVLMISEANFKVQRLTWCDITCLYVHICPNINNSWEHVSGALEMVFCYNLASILNRCVKHSGDRCIYYEKLLKFSSYLDEKHRRENFYFILRIATTHAVYLMYIHFLPNDIIYPAHFGTSNDMKVRIV